jgi:hypothetical protein
MELIERYLQAVKFALPKSQQEDITRELRDSILSQVEDRESELGRPLTEGEQVELLKKMGSPTRLAGRYSPHQHLIGPGILPIYWKVLKAGLGIALIVVAVSSIAIAAAGKPFNESLRAFLNYPNVAMTVFAWVTLVFATLEFLGAKFRVSDCWDPRQLPAVSKQHPTRTRAELIGQLLIQALFAVWWLTGLHYQHFIFGPGVNFFRFSPVWLSLFPYFVVMIAVDMSFTVAMLLRPQWTIGRRISGIVMSALGLALVLILIQAPELFVPAHPSPETVAQVNTVNYALHLGLIVAAIVNVVNITIGGGKLILGKLGDTSRAVLGS